MNAQELQIILDIGTIAVAVFAAIFSLSRRSIDLAQRGGSILLIPVALIWLLRSFTSAHLPIFGAYESALSLTLFSGITLWFAGRLQKLPLLTIFPPVAAAMLFHGTRYSREIWALTISERGFWVHLHAIFAFLAFGLAMCLLSASFLVLTGRDAPLKKTTLLLVALYALNIISGSFYRFLLLGKAWSFDPIESMNLACFLALTTLIHLMSFTKMTPKKAASWSIVCIVLFVLAYRLILIFPGWSSYHILDIGIRSHIIPK